MNMSEMLQNIEIIFCSINFIDKMRSWISKMCWVSTWFGRIYVLREIYRARRKLDRLIIRDYPNKPACGGSLQSSSFFANRETNSFAAKVLLEDRWPMITIHQIRPPKPPNELNRPQLADRKTESQKDRKAERQKDRKTKRQKHRNTERQ